MNEIFFFFLSCDINLVCIFVKSECTAGDGARHEQNGDYVFDGYLWQRVCIDRIYSLCDSQVSDLRKVFGFLIRL